MMLDPTYHSSIDNFEQIARKSPFGERLRLAYQMLFESSDMTQDLALDLEIAFSQKEGLDAIEEFSNSLKGLQVEAIQQSLVAFSQGESSPNLGIEAPSTSNVNARVEEGYPSP